MRTRPLMHLLVAALLAGACASGSPDSPAPATAPTPAVPAPLFPSGMYDFIATMGIEARTGTLEIVHTAAGLTGEAWLEGEGSPAVIEGGTVDGNRVVLNALGGGNPVTFELDFAGPAFSGIAFVPGDTILLDGTLRAP